MRIDDIICRGIFCAYWLYFYGVRGLLGRVRALDYLAISLVMLGLMWLAGTKRLSAKLVGWVSVIMCPLALAVVYDPSRSGVIFVAKTYLLALFLASYFKAMRLTLVECVCFVLPIIVSAYYFVNPRPSDEWQLLQGRMSGIDEPNFTSLFLIQAMCAAFGLHLITETRRVKVMVIATMLVCLFGVVLTASRAGLIAALCALSLMFFVRRKMYYAGTIVAVATLLIVLSPGLASRSQPVVVQRFDIQSGEHDLSMLTNNRNVLAEQAWHDIERGKWLIGGGPQAVSQWGEHSSFNVPHNSLLDFGLAFGKASFYFYGLLLAVLLAVNVRIVIMYRFSGHCQDKSILLAAVLFLSLFPMYMSLSGGLAMHFVLWVVLGSYSLFHRPVRFPRVSLEGPRYRRGSAYRALWFPARMGGVHLQRRSSPHGVAANS